MKLLFWNKKLIKNVSLGKLGFLTRLKLKIKYSCKKLLLFVPPRQNQYIIDGV
jgi:hypothetical protein